MPFKGLPRKEETADVTVPDLTLLSYKGVTGVTENSSSGATQMSIQSQSQSQQRKTRRCWSPELHRRFVSSLQQLGGAQGQRNLKLEVFHFGIFFICSHKWKGISEVIIALIECPLN